MRYFDPTERQAIVEQAAQFCKDCNWKVSELARAVSIPYPTLRAWTERERIPSERFKTLQQLNRLDRFLKSKGYAE